MKQLIVDTALSLAECSSWESVRLHQVGRELDLSLAQIRREFPQKEDIVDAWFDRADQAMLESVANGLSADLEMEQRIHHVMMAWFDALSPHRVPTRQMVFNKLELGHIHYQFAGAMRVSRTVQWMREAAGLDDRLPWRAFSETGTTAIYLATFLFWMYDNSDGAENTRNFLRARLKTAGSVAARLCRMIPG